MDQPAMREIADMIADVIEMKPVPQVRERAIALCEKFPLYG